MFDCQGEAEVTLKVKFRVKGSLNSSYSDIKEYLEDEAVEQVIGMLPDDWGLEVTEVKISDCESQESEREIEHDEN